ncbi:MAG TPA: hypothetical protein VF178_06365 [Gemmatimonadaceae bacterium]
MNHTHPSDPSLAESAAKWAFGFFGAMAAFLLLPRAVRFFVKRLVWGVLGEVIAVVVAGLLAEKAAERVGRTDDR